MVLFTLYSVGIMYAMFIVFLFINPQIEINSATLSALGIMISAFIASFSVRESILNTNRLEVEKVKRELFDRRKKVVFLLGELFTKLVSAHNSSDIIVTKQFLNKCKDVLADSKYIFDKSDYLIIENFQQTIFRLISLANSIENKREQNLEVSKLQNSTYQLQYHLLECLHENLDALEGSIQLKK